MRLGLGSTERASYLGRYEDSGREYDSQLERMGYACAEAQDIKNSQINE